MFSVAAIVIAAWLWTSPTPRLLRTRTRARGRTHPAGTLRRVAKWRGTRPADEGAIVGAILVAVAARLRAGQGPAQAWRASLANQPAAIARALAQAIPGATLDAGLASGVGTHTVLAPATRAAIASARAATELAGTLGAELAQVLHACAGGIEESARAAADRDAALSGPASTSRLLLGLPVAGVGLGMLIGADPVSFLTGTPLGWALLVVALALTGVGQWWIRRLIAHAARATGAVDPGKPGRRQ